MATGFPNGGTSWRDQMLAAQVRQQQSSLIDWQQSRMMQENAIIPRYFKEGDLPLTIEEHSKPVQKQKESKKMGTSYVREYFIKHRDTLMGLTVVLLLDHFIFEGAFREKIKKIVHSFLDKAETKIHTIEIKP